MFKRFLKNKISWLIVLLIISMPFITTYLIIKPSPLKNFTTGNDWIGFFGSYTGAIVSGLITLFVMETTIENGDNNLKVSIAENKKIQKKSDRTIFCNELASTIANFCSECKKYVYYSTLAQNKYNTFLTDKKHLQLCESEFAERKSDPLYMRQIREGIETTELKKINDAKEKYNISKSELDESINKIESVNIMPSYFLLKIKLKNIDKSESILQIILKINNLIELDIDDENFNLKLKKLYLYLDELLDATSIFIDTYTQDENIE